MPQEIDRDEALAFIRAHGSELRYALAAAALGRSSATEAQAALAPLQNEDGGWRGLTSLDAPISTISSTILALHWMVLLGVEDGEALDRTVAYLARTQHPDGYWDEPAALANHGAKFWLLPGRYPNQLWYTAALCRYLQDISRAGEVDFDAALAFLRQGWDGTRFPDFAHTHWMALPLFSRLDQPTETDRTIVAGCKTLLRDTIAADDLSAGEISEIAHAALSAAPPDSALLEAALAHIRSEQDADGGWIVADGDLEDRVIETLQALFALARVEGQRK